MEKLEYVTTGLDLFNSADESKFFVTKGNVKKLPEILTPIIEYALKSKQLIEPTKEEMDKYFFGENLEIALRDRLFSNAGNYEANVKNYIEYLRLKEENNKPKIKETIKLEEIKPLNK